MILCPGRCSYRCASTSMTNHIDVQPSICSTSVRNHRRIIAHTDRTPPDPLKPVPRSIIHNAHSKRAHCDKLKTIDAAIYKMAVSGEYISDADGLSGGGVVCGNSITRLLLGPHNATVVVVGRNHPMRDAITTGSQKLPPLLVTPEIDCGITLSTATKQCYHINPATNNP